MEKGNTGQEVIKKGNAAKVNEQEGRRREK